MSNLQATGEPGARRLLGRDGIPEFTEHQGCGWIILAPVRTWDEWRELAQVILGAGDPDNGEQEGRDHGHIGPAPEAGR